ncbi:Ig domain protein group 1 domain protein [Desulfatibacillum aliphaticivorans]|uniref:Ig domain protein group 1 domain protein n=2 Tax=Desulfatibacillum aliphaticivorans TaxID=218208 RepID=B8FHA1_DESAL|nr:Ig domain protein group 1 domain protein [Desulfatibacillum aliphaticivorans]
MKSRDHVMAHSNDANLQDIQGHCQGLEVHEGIHQSECEDTPMKKFNLRSALLLMLGIIFLFFTACGPGGSGESDSSGGGGDDDGGGGTTVTNPTVAGAFYGATGADITNSTALLFSNPVEADGSDGSFETEDLKAGDHTIVVATTNDAYGTSYKNFTVGSSDMELFLFMPSATLPYVEHLATEAFTLNSNTVNGEFATLTMVAQTSGLYRLLGASGLASVNKADFRVENYDVNAPLPCDLPNVDNRATGLNATLGVQAPYVLVHVSPAMLRSLGNPGTLALPNPANWTTEKVLYFNPESHTWTDTNYTISDSVAGNMPITKGGLYGVFDESGVKPGTLRVNLDDINASSGDLILVGDQVIEVGSQDPITIYNVPQPVDGNPLQVVVLDPNGNTADATTVTVLPSGSYSWIDPITGATSGVTLSASASSVEVGGNTITLTVEVTDEYNKPVVGATVNFTTDAGTLSAASALTDADGEAQVTLSSSNQTVPTVTVGADCNGVDATDLTLSFVPGSPFQLALSSDTITLDSYGTDNADLTLVVKDQFGNIVEDGATVYFTVLDSSNATVTPSPITSDSLQTADGVVEATFSSALDPDVYSILGKYSETIVSNQVDITVVAAQAANISLQASKTTMTASGLDTCLITATVTDKYGNFVPQGTTVNFTAFSGTLSNGGVATVNSNGEASVTLTSSLYVGTETVEATVNSISEDINLTYIPGPPAHIAFERTSITAYQGSGAEIAIRCSVTDNYGPAAIGHNPVADGTTIYFYALDPNNASIGTVLSSSSATTNNGMASVNFSVPSDNPGSYTVQATYQSVEGDTPVTINVLQTEPANVSVAAASDSIVADGASHTTITATVYDQYDNLMGDGVAVTFTTTSGTLDATVGNGGTATYNTVTSGGIATVRLYSAQLVGSTTVRADVGGVTGTVDVDFVAGAPASVTVSLSTSNMVADGESTANVTALVLDANANPVPDTTVQFSVEAGGGRVVPVSDTTDENGYVTVTYIASSTGGTYLITATCGQGITGNKTMVLQDLVISSLILTAYIDGAQVTGDVPELVADGTSNISLWAELTDNAGNPVEDGTVVTFVTTQGDLTYIGAGSGGGNSVTAETYNGIAKATLTSSTTAGTTAFITATSSSLVDSMTVAFVPGAPYRIDAYANPSSIPSYTYYCPGDTARVYATVYDRTNNLVADGTEVVFSIDRGWIWDDYPLCPEDGYYTVVASKTEVTANGVAKIGVLGNNTGTIETGTVNVCVDGLCYEDPTRPAPDNRGVQISYGSTGASSGLPTRIVLSVDTDDLFIAGSGKAESCIITAVVYDETGDPIQDNYSAGDGLISATERTFQSASATFITSGYDAGDYLVISSGEYAGSYEIVSVDNEHQVTLNTGANPFGSTETGVSFTAYILNNIEFKILNGPNNQENIDGNEGVGATSLKSTSSGIAYATFNSGYSPGPVSIQVTCTQGGQSAVATYSDIVIGAGNPSVVNLYPHNEINSSSGANSMRQLDAVVTDKFGSPVPNGTAVYFGLLDEITVSGAGFTVSDSGARSQVVVAEDVSNVNAGDTFYVGDEASDYNGGYTIYSVSPPNTIVLDKQIDAGVSADNYIIGYAEYGNISGSQITGNGGVSGVAVNTILFPTYTAGNKMVYIYALAYGADSSGNSVPVYDTWSGYYSPSRTIGSVLVSAGSTSLIANGTAETMITAEIFDSTGAAVADGVTVTFTSQSGTLSDATADTVNGEATVTLTSPTTAGVDNITACVQGVCGDLDVTYVAGQVSTLSLSLTPSNLTADGESTSVVEVVARDANFNLVDGVTVSFTADYGTLSSGAAQTDSQGYATVTFTAPSSVPAGSQAVVTAKTSNGTTATGNIALVAASVETVELTSGVSEIVANGASSALVTATVLDNNENAVPDGTIVTFTTSAGTLNDSTSTTPVANQTSYDVTTVNGVAKVLLYSATNLGTATVNAVAGGIGDSISIAFIPGPPAKVSVSATPSSLTADGASQSLIKATVLDANDNPVADGETITFSVTQDGGSLDSLTRQTVGGIASVTYTAPASVPGAQVRVYASSTSGDSGNVIIELTGPSIASVSLEVDPTSLPADGSSTATIFATITLSGGGAAPDGTTVNFEIFSGGGQLSATSATTSGGIAQVELTADSNAGTAVIKAECGGRTAEVDVEYEPGSVSVSVEQNSLLGTGEETTEIRVLLAKADGSVITVPQTVTFTLSDLSMGHLSHTTGNTSAPDFDEFNSCIFTGGTKGGTVEVIAKWTTSGVEVTGSAIIDIQPPPAFLQLASGYPLPASINIKGTGGQTTSQLVFNVLDSVGDLVADGYIIDFAIGDGAGGGEQVIPTTALTSSGQVGTILQSGWASGTVNVKATYHHDRTVNISASKVTITNGPPVGEGLNMSPEYNNISGIKITQLEDLMQVTANDKYNNRIPEGSAIFFATYGTGGMLASGSAFTDGEGKASDTLISTASAPTQGWVSVTAEATNGGRTTQVTSMAFSPTSPDTNMYIGTNGGGVYKSNDGGASWTNVSIPSGISTRQRAWLDPYVNDVCVDPDDANTVFAATGYNGDGALYRSLSGGNEWNSNNSEEVFGCFNKNSEVTSVLCDGGGSDWVWVGTQSNGLWYTLDGSAEPNITWAQAGLSSALKSFSADDGVTANGSDILTSASATFQTNEFGAGDTVVISSGDDAGTYTVASVVSETEIQLNTALNHDTSAGAVTTGGASVQAGSAVLVDGEATFDASGFEAGDTITVFGGKDAGTYTIQNVDSETQLTLNADFTTTVGDVMDGSDGQQVSGQVVFTSATAKFVDEGFAANDRLIITSGDDIGMYMINTVVDNNTVYLDKAFTSTYADPVTGNDAQTAAGSATITLPNTDLYDLIEAGYYVALTSGADLGAYTVNSLASASSLVLNSNMTTAANDVDYMLFYGKANPDQNNNGIYRKNGSNQVVFYSDTASFLTDGFKANDILLIESGTHTGAYYILGVLSEKTLLLQENVAGAVGEETGLNYTLFHNENSVSYKTYHRQSGYSTGSDNSYWSNVTNGFSVYGSAVINSSGSTFVTDGYEVGDIVTINSGSDAGVYTIVELTESSITLDRELTQVCGPVFTAEDLQTTKDSAIVRSSDATFVSDGFDVGDAFIIASGADLGTYSIVEVIDQTQVRLDADMTTTALDGNITYRVYHACDSVDFNLYHVGLTSITYVANHLSTLVSFTVTSSDVSGTDAGPQVRDGKWVRDIIKVDGSGSTAVIYAGTQTGVYRSANGGQTWNFLKDSFEGSTIKTLDGTKIGNDEIVYAGTEDAGLWIYVYDTVAKTGTWHNYTDGLDRALLVTSPEADVDNVGNGTLSDMSVTDDSETEFWTLTCKTANAGAGIFSLVGTVSGAQPDVDISAGAYTCPYLKLTLNPGAIDFEVGDTFTFNTVRDDGSSVTDIVVDMDNELLYAATIYYEGSDVYHEVGNLKVVDIDPLTGLPVGDWRDATTGLAQFDPPDDETLFAIHTIALSNDPNTGTPQAIFAGGQGIHLYKATDGVTTSGTTDLSTGDVYWGASENGLDNTIMTRRVILFSGEVGFQAYNEASETLYFIGGASIITPTTTSDWAEVLATGDSGRTVEFTFYVQDINGNPPIVGTTVMLRTYKLEEGDYKEIDTITLKTYGDDLISGGTWRDPTNEDTNVPFIYTINFGDPIVKVEFILTQSASCNSEPVESPGCNGGNETLTYTYR